MCQWCQQHGDRDHRWYEKVENYMFTKIFPDEAGQEKSKAEMTATFSQTEWRYSQLCYARQQTTAFSTSFSIYDG